VIPGFQRERIVEGMGERRDASVNEVLSYLADNGVANLAIGEAVDLLVDERGLTREDAEAALRSHPAWADLADLSRP
jgi:hypothetical protein